MQKKYMENKNNNIYSSRAQDKQDKIFRHMSANRKVALTAKFSNFVLNLSNLKHQNGFSKTASKNLKNS